VAPTHEPRRKLPTAQWNPAPHAIHPLRSGQSGAQLALYSTAAQHRIDNLANKKVPINCASFVAVPDA
jgi:hypothetical protein